MNTAWGHGFNVMPPIRRYIPARKVSDLNFIKIINIKREKNDT